MPASWKSAAIALLMAAIGGGWYLRERGVEDSPPQPAVPCSEPRAIEDAAWQAFKAHASGRIITARGTVERILSDDRDGSPHQRFIIRTPRKLSLLIAHNLDLAPRLEGLKPGEAVTVFGEYEWNEKGGVMHWTHDDPQGQHVTGYIEWRGRRYQ